MTGSPVLLEQFPRSDLVSSVPFGSANDQQFGFADQDPGTSSDLSLHDLAQPGDQMAEQSVLADDGTDLPPMDEPLIRPALGVEDPEEAQVAHLRQELEDAGARLGQLIAQIEEDRNRYLASAARAAVDHVAGVGGELLDHLIRDGFCAEVAQCVLDLSGRLPGEDCDLAVASQDHDSLAALLSAEPLEMAIKLVSDPALAQGQARLRWSDGGADFDAARIAEAAATLLQSRLAELRHHPVS